MGDGIILTRALSSERPKGSNVCPAIMGVGRGGTFQPHKDDCGVGSISELLGSSGTVSGSTH